MSTKLLHAYNLFKVSQVNQCVTVTHYEKFANIVLKGVQTEQKNPFRRMSLREGSSCESVFLWYKSLSDQASALGIGVIVLEKQGICREGIDVFVYNGTNCLQNRLEDYIVCLENAHLICPGWEGKPIFWGESEGGMLATALASQTPQTAAVLLLGAGGGMTPREEVKWTLKHRMGKQGAMKEMIDEYMSFLDEQLDTMLLDPTPEKQFLGNTYRWWASFLAAKEAVDPLTQQSLPICLIHGIEDSQIPVLSADLAAEKLAKTNALTYLRLEGYGHDLDTPDVYDAASRWLGSILFSQKPLDNICVAQTASAPSRDFQGDISDYVFSRGKGEVSAGVEAGKDSQGNDRVSAEVGGTYRSDDGWSVGVDVGVSGNRDRDGNARGEVHGRAEISKDF